MADKECPFCKQAVEANASICKHCKKELVPISTKKWYQTRMGSFIVLSIGIAIIYSLAVGQYNEYRRASNNSVVSEQNHLSQVPSTKAPSKKNVTIPKPDKSNDAFLVAIENRAKEYNKILKENYPSDEMKKAVFTDLAQAVIAEGNYSKPENKKEKEILSRIKKIIPILDMLQRDMYAMSIENQMLKKGLNVDIKAVGSQKQTLIYKYVLMTRAIAYKIANDGNLLASAKNIGFTKVKFSDGFNESWTYDLTK